MTGFETFFVDLFETFSNAALGLDPESRERLGALEGRCVQIESTAPQQVLTLIVRDARITMIAEPTETPNVIVRGRMQDLLAWFAAPRQGRIEIEGDETTLLEFVDAFKRITPDPFPFGPPFTEWAASDVGQNLLGAAEVAIASIRSAVEGAASSIQQSAASQYVSEAHVSAFLDGMDDLRLRVDRLAARVDAAEQAGS